MYHIDTVFWVKSATCVGQLVIVRWLKAMDFISRPAVEQ